MFSTRRIINNWTGIGISHSSGFFLFILGAVGNATCLAIVSQLRFGFMSLSIRARIADRNGV